jgi:hypothetical protein
MLPGAWGSFMKLQNTQNLKNNERLNSIFQETSKNLKRLGFQNYLKSISQNIDHFA